MNSRASALKIGKEKHVLKKVRVKLKLGLVRGLVGNVNIHSRKDPFTGGCTEDCIRNLGLEMRRGLREGLREARVTHAVSALPLTTEKKVKPSRGLDVRLM